MCWLFYVRNEIGVDELALASCSLLPPPTVDNCKEAPKLLNSAN